MRLITDDSVTASFGLAADECLAARVGVGERRDVACSVPTLRLYTYRSHCALVGRFQNLENEVHRAYCAEHNLFQSPPHWRRRDHYGQRSTRCGADHPRKR